VEIKKNSVHAIILEPKLLPIGESTTFAEPNSVDLLLKRL